MTNEDLIALRGALVIRTNVQRYPEGYNSPDYDGPTIAPAWRYTVDERPLERRGLTRAQFDQMLADAGLDPVVVPADEGDVLSDAAFEALSAPKPELVTAHAENLIERGVVVNITGLTEPIYVQGRDKDTRNVQGLVTAAQLRLASGDTTTLTDFRDGNNVTHQLVPAQVIQMWQLSAGYISAVYAASWAIKALDPIPSDWMDETRWPDSGLTDEQP